MLAGLNFRTNHVQCYSFSWRSETWEVARLSDFELMCMCDTVWHRVSWDCCWRYLTGRVVGQQWLRWYQNETGIKFLRHIFWSLLILHLDTDCRREHSLNETTSRKSMPWLGILHPTWSLGIHSSFRTEHIGNGYLCLPCSAAREAQGVYWDNLLSSLFREGNFDSYSRSHWPLEATRSCLPACGWRQIWKVSRPRFFRPGRNESSLNMEVS